MNRWYRNGKDWLADWAAYYLYLQPGDPGPGDPDFTWRRWWLDRLLDLAPVTNPNATARVALIMCGTGAIAYAFNAPLMISGEFFTGAMLLIAWTFYLERRQDRGHDSNPR